ncbi:hypothetical protein HDA40_005534 [Hamadaea flava]|uniref:Uncharacterized protein n=1 Tax=Hamadaea flava TaxID=1742688 RepID=A0ABV8LZM0_9ACTN|nr:hypothetical protein [Hamadaea flava]MCP2327027.1 hypothetical protein [Hamadaea flava]
MVGHCPSDPDWIGYFDAAEYCTQAGSCYLDLRKSETADQWFAQALKAMPADKGCDRATHLLRRAETAVRSGIFLAAGTFAWEAKPLMKTARAARNDGRLRDLQWSLRRRGPRGRELTNRLSRG